MRILIILPDYYPKQNPRVFRWQALAEHWASKGWAVDVLTSSHSKCPAIENLHGVVIHRTGQGNMMDLMNNVLNKENRRREIQKGQKTDIEKLTRVWTILGTIFHWVWKNIYWPDGTCIWISPAKRKAQHLLKTNNYDSIVSVSLPFSSHLVGLSIKRRFPKITWMVDIGDPFSTLLEFPKNNLIFYKKQNHLAEKKVIELADSVVLTSYGAITDFQHNFPRQTKKIHVIPPLFTQSNAEHIEENSRLVQGRINIGYFGSFYAGIRQPEVLLDLFRQLIVFEPGLRNRIALHVFGYIEPKYKQTFQKFDRLHGCLFLHGLIEKNDVSQIMTKCDFLVNVGNTTASQLPSKSVDYIMTGKPIINICQRPDDTFRLFLQDYPLLFNVFGESGKFAKQQIEALFNFIEKDMGKSVGEGWIKRKAKDFGVEATAKQYEQLLGKAG